MLFVSAPLYVSAAREAFAQVDARYESVARTLGDDVWRAFRRITLPLAARGLTAAAVVMWARAVSEFGAIVILTYNPKVASVLSYDRFTSFGLSEALPVAAVLVLFALVPLAALRALRRERRAWRSRRLLLAPRRDATAIRESSSRMCWKARSSSNARGSSR